MNNTKKVVAYALALSVASQAIPSTKVHAEEVNGQINQETNQTSSNLLIPSIELVGDCIQVNSVIGINQVGDCEGFFVKAYSPSNPNNYRSIDLNYTGDDSNFTITGSFETPKDLGDVLLVELYSEKSGEYTKLFGPKRLELVSEVVDQTAPSTNNDLEVTVSNSTSTLNIIQKGIYDLESGLDVNSVKSYVYEEDSSDKGKAIKLTGNDFSDFSGTVKAHSTKDLVVEVYASDLAGNESLVGSKTVSRVQTKESKASKASSNFEFRSSYFDSEYLIYKDGGFVVSGSGKIDTDFVLEVLSDSKINSCDIIVNTNPDDYNSGVVLSTSLGSDGSTTDRVNTGVMSFNSSSISNSNRLYTIESNLHFDKTPADGSTYYVWYSLNDDNGGFDFSKLQESLSIDSVAPSAEENVELEVSSDSVLFIRQPEVIDEGVGVKRVFAVVKHPNIVSSEQIDLTASSTSVYSGSVDLKKLGIEKGTITVEIFAEDSVGNSALVNLGKFEKDTYIDSVEKTTITSEAYNQDSYKWFKYGKEFVINSDSNSKSKVYSGAQIIITEDLASSTSKILAEFKLGSKEDFANITDNPYFELVNSSYTTGKSEESGYDYVNVATATIKVKDRLYNKPFSVWVKYYTDDGLESPISRDSSNLKTDYVRPSISVNKISTNYEIDVTDYESGIRSVSVYNADGKLLDDNFTEGETMKIEESLNPATVTVIDNVGNRTVYDLIKMEEVAPSSQDVLPSMPMFPDEYISADDIVLTPPTNGDNGDNAGDSGDSDNTGDNTGDSGDNTGDNTDDSTGDNGNNSGDNGNNSGDNNGGNLGDSNDSNNSNGSNNSGNNSGGVNDGNSNNSSGDNNSGGQNNNGNISDNNQNSDSGNDNNSGNNTNTDGDSNNDSDDTKDPNADNNQDNNGQNSQQQNAQNNDNNNQDSGQTIIDQVVDKVSDVLPNTGGTNTGILGAFASMMTIVGTLLFRKRK